MRQTPTELYHDLMREITHRRRAEPAGTYSPRLTDIYQEAADRLAVAIDGDEPLGGAVRDAREAYAACTADIRPYSVPTKGHGRLGPHSWPDDMGSEY